MKVLERTIHKISQYTMISPALDVDVAILKRARQAVNGEKVTFPISWPGTQPVAHTVTVNSSFSSSY